MIEKKQDLIENSDEFQNILQPQQGLIINRLKETEDKLIQLKQQERLVLKMKQITSKNRRDLFQKIESSKNIVKQYNKELAKKIRYDSNKAEEIRLNK